MGSETLMVALPEFAQPTRDAIFAAEESAQESGFRPHLGGSLIGHPCSRALWYTFRWATVARHSGRLLRLFDRGQTEETRIIAALRKIGATVIDIDPETGRQWRLTDPTGHSGGSMDGVATGLPEAPQSWAGLEFKTHNDKSFRALSEKGVRSSKPMHWAQMHFYAGLADLDRFLYVGVNKNDDDIYTEWVHIDADESAKLIARARTIVLADRPPARISERSDWWECRICDHARACHAGDLPPRHCRSCMHSTPIDGGAWRCERHDALLDLDAQRAGCGQHLYHPDLVAGAQIDCGEDWMEYEMNDGMVWRDEGPDK